MGAARRALWAPLLSPVGAGAFAVFLWFWVGTPTGNYTAQRVAWGEKSSVLAVFIQARTFVREFIHWHGWANVNLNLPTGFLGAALLIWGIRQMWLYRRGLVAAVPASSVASSTHGLAVGSGGVTVRSGGAVTLDSDAVSGGAHPTVGADGAGADGGGRGISLGAWVWTIGVAVLTLTSDKTPPNPRMLLCAFPVLVAIAAPRTGRRQRILLGISGILLVAMSIGTFAGGGLRP